MLRELARRGSAAQRELAIRNLTLSAEVRGYRQGLADSPAKLEAAVVLAGKERIVYDAQNSGSLPGLRVRGEGDPATGDLAADEAYDGAGATYDLYKEIYGRDSIDGSGMRMNSTVHYQRGYDNAFWNGSQMVYGDGDEDLPEAERLFNRFTIAIDIIGHELTHGVTQHEANLVYRDQPGALNESMSDVFGVLVKQRVLSHLAREADWLVGAGLFTTNVNGVALRSMKEPGTAYNDPVLGKDPQPGHMDDYQSVSYDNGGVHINSGIPNRAFYVAAYELDGFAWEKMGRCWYDALTNRLASTSNFQAAANATFAAAESLFGRGSLEQQAVQTGWSQVGIFVEDSDNDPPPDDPTPNEPQGCLPTVKSLLGF
ncbi:MAG: M4 family metallopeptidase [Chloroflexi bacterium]|nr:M4 family metallopeptidase [Chloroflexota bacterium]